MENNVVKENCLEVLPKNEIMNNIQETTLPVLRNNENLLPTVIKQRELALIEIKREFYNIKQNHSAVGILKFLKNTLLLLAKFVRWSIMASSKVLGFIAVSAIIVISTTIITKNIINSKYSVDRKDDETTYSIFRLKDSIDE